MTDKFEERDKPDESPDDPYEVGYGKPPREHQFKKGESGNRKGRPKGSVDVKATLREALLEPVVVNDNGRRYKIPRYQAMIKMMTGKAAQGDTRAQRQLLALMEKLGWLERETVPLLPPKFEIHFTDSPEKPAATGEDKDEKPKDENEDPSSSK